jgi:hypothetical protein
LRDDKNHHLKIAALLFIWTLAVYLAGPLVTALVRATAFQVSFARTDEEARTHARYVIAHRLLDVYDARNPPPLMLHQIEHDYCGYAPSSDDAVEKGLDYLFVATILTDNQFQRQLRLERFTTTISDFGFAFLGNCISSTVLAHQCELYVGRVLERNGIRYTRDLPSGSPDQHEQKVQHAVNCRYLDGVAVRAGRPLAKPDIE